MPLGPTFYGDVGFVWDERHDPTDLASVNHVGGTVVWGYATSAMNPGDAVVIDTAADHSYATTASANATTAAGVVVAGRTNQDWDYAAAIASGAKILVRITGVARVTASAAILRGARVGTSTTAGRVVTSTTAGAILGKALTAATTAGDTIYILLASS